MELEIIRHCDISHNDLLRVINIKNAAWPHLIESQLKWIEENQFADDLHVILKEGSEDYAYMDLCPVVARVDGKETTFMGIGNVCSKTKEQGHGGELLSQVNIYLKKSGFIGLLFCKESVKLFYEHYGWKVVKCESMYEKGIYALYFSDKLIKEIIYNDREF